jgi:hypothetical protein
MSYFYNPEFESDNEVLDAWYNYVLKFLPLVNKKWREMTTNDKLRNQQSMFHSITISDEALVQWFIQLWEPILNNRLNKKLCVNEDNKKEHVRKPHDTKQNIKQYTLLHHNITIARRDYNAAVRWNNLFWGEVKKKNSDLLKQKTPNKYSRYNNDISELPLPDLNENQEFLASYHLNSDFSGSTIDDDNHKNSSENQTESTQIVKYSEI